MAAGDIKTLEADLGVPGIRIISTLRSGGASPVPYRGMNLGDHVGDQADCVASNRRQLQNMIPGNKQPIWLRQVHGSGVVAAHRVVPGAPPEADAAWTDQTGVACGVLTADCLPIVLAADTGRAVAVVHAGWRGLAAGVIEATLAAMPAVSGSIRAWLGPAIGPCCYEVGSDFRDVFLKRWGAVAAGCFTAGRMSDKFQADLYGLAAQRLDRAGVSSIAGGDQCTACNADDYFSHRRDGITGRMATVATLLPA